MKIRKEFLIFGGIVVAFVAAIVITTILGRESHYNGDNVVMNFGTDINEYDENGEILVPEFGDFDGVTMDEIEEAYVAEDTVTGGYLASVDYPAGDDDIVTPTNPPEGEEGEVANAGEGEEPRVEEPAVDIPRPSANEYVMLVCHFVCGIDDPLMESYITPALKTYFRNQLDEYPYFNLEGNMVYSDVQMPTDKTCSFVAKDGLKYTFEVEFSGDAISSITPI